MKKLLLIPFALLLASCDTGNQVPGDSEAEMMAHQLIKAQTIDPDGVEFIDGNAKMQQMPDSSFVFVGYVKMPNRLSQKVTMAYNVGIKWKGGNYTSDTSWAVKFCHITNP